MSNKDIKSDIYVYQDYLIRKIDLLCFQLSDKPEACNRLICDCVHKLEALMRNS